MTSSPATSVPLKTRLERSPKVPRWLKCFCHHVGSGVSTIAVRVPSTTKTMSSDAMRCVVIDEADVYAV